MDVNIKSTSDPEKEDQNTVLPLSSEMIGSLTQQEQPRHVLNSKHLRKVQRLADEIQTGELMIRIVNGQLVSIDQTRRYIYTNKD